MIIGTYLPVMFTLQILSEKKTKRKALGPKDKVCLKVYPAGIENGYTGQYRDTGIN